jgi:hypothetical protein
VCRPAPSEHPDVLSGQRQPDRQHEPLAAGTGVTANDRVTIGSELAPGGPGAYGAQQPPSSAPSSSRRGRFREPTRRHRPPGEGAVLSNRRWCASHRVLCIAAADSATRTVHQRRDLEPISDASVLQNECFGALTRSLTEAFVITVLLWEISVCLTRFNARDRERCEHPQDHRVFAIPCRIRDHRASSDIPPARRLSRQILCSVQRVKPGVLVP